MLERYCDALIIGTDISGLITAAFLARRGLTVHILDTDPFAGSEKEPDPFCISHLNSKLLRSILGRLNVPENDIHYLSKTDSPLQLIFPKKRIDISSNPITFYEELEREFPDQFDKLKIFFENLAQIKHNIEVNELYSLIFPRSFSEKRQLAKFVRANEMETRLGQLGLDLANHPALKSFLMAQIKLMTYTHLAQPFAFQVAELLNPSEGEVLSIKGGHHYLKKLFLDRIRHHEGAYRPNSKIEKFLYRDGIFEGVKLAGNEGSILSRYLIWNTELKNLPDLLPKLFRFRSLKKKIKKLKPSGYWFTSRFSLPQKFVPPPMKDNILVVQKPQDKLEKTNFLYLQLKNRKSEEIDITASYLLEPEYTETQNSRFDPIHNDILEILHGLFPFAGDNLQLTFPIEKPQTSEATLFALKENDFEIFKQTALAHPVYSAKPKSFVDLFPINYKTPTPNFFLTAPEILSSLGYEGKYMLGLKVTDKIWSDVEKEKKHAMKVERRIA